MPPRPDTAFSMALMTSVDVLHRSGADAVSGAGHQEQHHDEDDQAVHERRVSDERAGVRIAQRRSRRERQQTKDDETASSPNSAYRNPRDSSAESPPLCLRRCFTLRLRLILAQPRLDRFAPVMNAMRTVRNTTDAMENQRLAVRPMETLGSTRWMASLVNSTRTASSGLINMFTVNALGDRGESQSQPGEGMPTDAQEGRACQRNQDQIAGIRGDARHIPTNAMM